MTEYLIRSTLVFTLLCLPWFLWMKRQTFFQWQRFYLLAIALFSLVFPLLPAFGEEQIIRTEMLPVAISVLAGEPAAGESGLQLPVAELIYFGGLILFASVFIYRLVRLLILFANTNADADGIRVLESNGKTGAFSVFGSIFISQEMDEESRASVIRHEQVHIRQKHSIDILFYEILILLFWFNPMYRVVRKQLAATHEFIADEQACGDDPVRYKQVLVAHVLGLPRQALIHPFSEPGNLKQRMIMLTKNRTSKRARWAYLLVFPLAALVLSLNSFQLAEPAAIVAEADQAAAYPGGQEAMMKFLIANVHYPEQAKKAKEAGTVYVGFTVDKAGKIINPVIKRSVSATLDAEALRVVGLMPNWIPATKAGKAVDSEMVLPIKFTLD